MRTIIVFLCALVLLAVLIVLSSCRVSGKLSREEEQLELKRKINKDD